MVTPQTTSPAPSAVGDDVSTFKLVEGEERTRSRSKSMRCAPSLSPFDELRLLSEAYWDVQKVRIGLGQRLGSKQAAIEPLEAIIETVEKAENMASLAMRRAFRRAAPEIAAWTVATRGLGEHTVARLLGIIGHPVKAYPMSRVKGEAPAGHVCTARCGKTRPDDEGKTEATHLVAGEPFNRTVSQLWQYCGHGNAEDKRRKGMEQGDALRCGNPRAKTIVHMIAECAMKAGGPLREVYDAAKVKYAERDWKQARKHNAALREVGKEFLRQLWIVAGAQGQTRALSTPKMYASDLSPSRDLDERGD